jgi:hypothetical protein
LAIAAWDAWDGVRRDALADDCRLAVQDADAGKLAVRVQVFPEQGGLGHRQTDPVRVWVHWAAAPDGSEPGTQDAGRFAAQSCAVPVAVSARSVCPALAVAAYLLQVLMAWPQSVTRQASLSLSLSLLHWALALVLADAAAPSGLYLQQAALPPELAPEAAVREAQALYK